MGDKTGIEWTDATWNPVSGCSKVSQGCKNCYAERVFTRPYPGRAFTDVRCHPERLDQPLRWRKPRRIFVNSMSDLFHEAVPYEFIDRVFAVMALARQHTFQILTKRAVNMCEYFGARPNSRRNYIIPHFARFATNDDVQGFSLPLPNVWLGVSVEDAETAQERVPHLWSTPAAVRFVSYEPAIGPMAISVITIPAADVVANTGRHLIDDEVVEWARNGQDIHLYDLGGIDWVIAGGESGPNARPARPEWFRWCRDDCARGGVAFFFKQWGEWAPAKNAPEGCRTHIFEGGGHCRHQIMARIGKARAGRHLDGHIHADYPETKP